MTRHTVNAVGGAVILCLAVNAQAQTGRTAPPISEKSSVSSPVGKFSALPAAARSAIGAAIKADNAPSWT